MSKFKFKVGDTVKVLDGSHVKDYTYGWYDHMNRFINKCGEVTSRGTDLDGRNYYRLDNFPAYRFDERGLAKKCSNQIVVEKHGNTVVAKYGDKVGIAKCSPEDTFDMKTGAMLAIERLFLPKYKVGDVIIGNEKADGRYLVIKKGWTGIVTNVYADDGECVIDAKGSDTCGNITTFYALNPCYFDKITVDED